MSKDTVDEDNDAPSQGEVSVHRNRLDLLTLFDDLADATDLMTSQVACPKTSLYMLGRHETVAMLTLHQEPDPSILIYRGVRASYNMTSNSLLCFGASNPLRVYAFDFITSKFAENGTLLLIILNSITLALDAADFSDSSFRQFLHVSEYFFLFAFTAEMLCKILALGFIMHPHSYMRGTWNVIDFAVVLAGYSIFFPSGANVSVVRLARVIRPLRTISRVAGMRIIMNSIICSIPTLLEVFLLLTFLITIFAIFGMGNFAGKWHHRCHVMLPSGPSLVMNDTLTCGTGRSCATNGVTLPQVCIKGDYHDSVLNFDHILSAALLVFKIITLDDWPEDMRKAQNAFGFISFVYFLTLVIVGGYFCINLVLAILSSIFSQEADAQAMDAVQMACLIFRSGDCLVPAHKAQASNPGGQNPPDGDPSNVLDKHKSTKWTDYNLSDLVITFPAMVSVDSYTWTTARDAPQCDPVSWRLGGSKDGLVWEHIDEVCNHPTPTERKEELQVFTIKSPDMFKAYKFTTLKRRLDDDNKDSDDDEDLGASTISSSQADENRDQHFLASLTPWIRRPRNRISKLTPSPRSSFDTTEESELEVTGCRGRVQAVVLHAAFRWFILFVTIVNVATMAVDHHGISSQGLYTINYIIFWCTVIFAVEMVVKLYAMGVRGYFYDRYNTFDCVLVLVSIPEVVFAIVNGVGGRGLGSAMLSFRMFRLARFARVAERLESLRILLETIVESVLSVVYLFLILLLFVFVFAILGLQLFKEEAVDLQKSPDDYTSAERNHFNSLPQALLTVFVIITGESWSAIMKKSILSTSWGAALYFIVLFVFGNYVLLNLFVAILIYNFSYASSKRREEVECSPRSTRSGRHPIKILKLDNPLLPPRKACGEMVLLEKEKIEGNVVARWYREKLREGESEQQLQGNSFGLFTPSHPLRRGLARVVLHPFFDNAIIFVIICNAVFLSLDSPSNLDKPGMRRLINTTDIVFTIVFTLEAIAKCITLGVYHNLDDDEADDAAHPGYLNSMWNRIDLFVVVTALAGLGFPPFKLFRSLRLVRLVILSPDLRILVLSLIMALPQIAYVVVVCLFVWLVFGILGVSLFKGTFYYCTDLTITHHEHCTGVYITNVTGWDGNEETLRDRVWRRPHYHFDDIGHAMMTLFEVAVGDGWARIMYTGVDSSLDSAKGLQRDANVALSLYFVVFMIVGGFFLMNLFVGMLIDHFGRMKAEKDGTACLSDTQRLWLRVTKVMSRTKLYKVPIIQYANPVLDKISKLTRHRYFEYGILVLIVINMSFMSTAHEGQSGSFTSMLLTVNHIFNALFAVEAVIKIIGLGPSVYFNDNWCRFDFLLVVTAYLGAEQARVLRIGRIFRLIKRAKSLEKLFTTLMYALPSLGNITAFLIVVFFMFGVVGVSLFGRVTTQNNKGLDANNNFRDLGHAIVLLFTIATTESWTDVMNACSVSASNTSTACDPGPDCGVDCCGTDWAILYFVSFMVLGSFVALNLLITVMLDQFQEEDVLNGQEFQTKAELLRELRQKWLHFDKEANSSVSPSAFIGILRNLPGHIAKTLGMRSKRRRKENEFMCFLASLSLPVVSMPTDDPRYPRGYRLCVQYEDAQRCVAMKAFDVTLPDVQEVRAAVQGKAPLAHPSQMFCLHHYYAVRKLCHAAAAVKRNKERSKLNTSSQDTSLDYEQASVSSVETESCG